MGHLHAGSEALVQPTLPPELAGYLFVANIFQVIGLQTTSAIVAAFIVQLTTIFTPLLEGLRGGDVKPRTWLSCTAAFFGVVLMTLSQSTTPAGALSLSSSSLTGDLLIFLASILYSLHVVRLGDISKSCSPLTLAASKASYELLYGTILILSSLLLSPYLPLPSDLSSFTTFFTVSLPNILSSPTSLTPIILATLWTGLITCAYTIFAQSYGQRTIPPSDANLIYTTQPVWSAIFAYVALGEKLEGVGWLGAAVIFAALGIEIYQPDRDRGG
ncbi:hypothetical protein TrCOL_g13786 [Triparma columacea]|uniref:EamA domain-containing protein n=1 Tax=Triparma columacea TaxID=722753 RepID=A0A9W7GKC6_9STRA|nr:hypothetical protein TrCOL_g13786 [Triparma columacea]